MRTWRRLLLVVPDRSREALIVALHEHGSLGVEERAGRLVAYFPVDIDDNALLARLQRELGAEGASWRSCESDLILDGAWHDRWLEKLEPFRVGKSFLVIPGHKGPRPTPGRFPIRLTPGRAFGTGEHPTTQMCMILIEECHPPASDLLDVGTGSGILAICARLRGAGRVVAIDTDEEAVGLAAGNAIRSGADGISFAVADLESISAGRFETLVANLNGTVLLRLIDRLVAACRKRLILSGILSGEEPRIVRAATAAGGALERRLGRGGWTALQIGMSR
ncbi:MAG: 50S ribosomal protein L11 methyltransferase [Acidobacteriota bacterium]